MGSVRLVLVMVSALACVLAGASSVGAHIGVTPGLLVVGDAQILSLSVHNDLDRPMTGLAVTAPTGIRIGLADVGDEWQAVIENGTATWTGGPLAPNTGATFEVDLAVDTATLVGPVQLQAEQLYPGGGSLPWPISVTVLPADEESSQRLTWAIAGGVALLVTTCIALLALRRRGHSLQEQ